MTTTTDEAAPDVLDTFAKQGVAQAIMMLFWKDRYRNPEMSVQVTEADLAEFRKCIEYLEIVPQVRIYRPQGRAAHPGTPKTARGEAMPARAAEPPRPFVVIQLVDKEGNGFKPIESTEEGAAERDKANELRRHRDRAASLADQIVSDASSGTTSMATIQDAARTLKALARA